MKLKRGIHLAYCTNVHRGETWEETFAYLNNLTLRVKSSVSPNNPYAIGLRLSDQASRELLQGDELPKFKSWLERNNCYVFTINGFPFGRFHGARVKEQVYVPDWSSIERLEYTNRLFFILAQLLPDGIEGSVSTLPGSFKEFINSPGQEVLIYDNVRKCAAFIADLSAKTGKTFHLGLEPEPLGLFETSAETVTFFDRLTSDQSNDQILQTIGVNYDSCHLAVEFEEPHAAIKNLRNHGIRISKIHLSSALKVVPTQQALQALSRFQEDVYLHQVIARDSSGHIRRFKDLDLALAQRPANLDDEWRIHFHIPIHSPPNHELDNTSDHVIGLLDLLKVDPAICQHLEMETYTWEVLPPDLKKKDVVQQIVQEYRWALDHLTQRGFC